MRRTPRAHDERRDATSSSGIASLRCAKHRTNFKNPHVSFALIQIVFGAAGKRIENAVAQIWFILRERIRDPRADSYRAHPS